MNIVQSTHTQSTHNKEENKKNYEVHKNPIKAKFSFFSLGASPALALAPAFAISMPFSAAKRPPQIHLGVF